MANQNKIRIGNINATQGNDQTVEVLYQKMGDRWYAFSLVGDDVFVGSLTDEQIHGAEGANSEAPREHETAA